MSNTKKSNIKLIVCSIILAICMLIPAFAGFQFNFKKEAFAGTSDNIVTDVSSELLSTYYNFNTSSNSKPATPSGWTEITTSSVNKDNIVRGIVDVSSETTFNTSTYKTSKPNMPTDTSSDKAYYKNLMINSHTGAGKFGYKSSSIALAEKGFYSISVKLYTHRTPKTETAVETDPTASIYLTGLTEDKKYEKSVKFENINTLTSWETYTFYIDTDDAINVNLELWLGSKTSVIQGAVFFNYVKIQRFSEDYYIEKISILEDEEDDAHNIISLSKQSSQPVDNSSFESTTPMQWNKIKQGYTANQRCEIIDVNNFQLTIDDTTINSPGSNNSAFKYVDPENPNNVTITENQNALFMYNKNNGFQAVESSKIKIEQLQYYRITFWAKSDCNKGSGATVYLVDKSETNPIESKKLTLATTYKKDDNKYRNDWTMYSFYIYGDEIEEKELTIQIWLGTESAKTNGYVFVDDFRIEDIDYQTFSNKSTSANSIAMNFNNDSDTFVVTNSNFNKTNNETATNKYPLAPANWSKSDFSSDNNTTFSGVINTNEDHFNAHIDEYHSDYNEAPTRPTTVGNENNNQSFISEDLTLSANSYYKLSFKVFTDYIKNDFTKNNGARVLLTADNITLFDYQNIYYTDNKWHQFVVYIKTNSNSQITNLALNFEELIGYVFFDDIRLETSSEAVYNSFYTSTDAEYLKVDLSKENFDNRTYNRLSNFDTPNNWTGAEQDNVNITKAGIISTDHTLLNGIAPTLSQNKNVLYIESGSNVNYNYTSNEKYSFTSATYYKISVNVLTKNILPENTIENPDVYGASFALSGLTDIKMTGINTNGEWKTYSIYVCLEDTVNSSISLGLGNTDKKVSGIAMFDNVNIITMSESEYKDETATADSSLFRAFINYSKPEEDTEDEASIWNNEANWIVIPSIITALAIIIAVVGFYVKKINFARKPKIKTKYDRRKTLDQDIDRREKIALRKQIIEELNAELGTIDKEIEEFNILAQKQLDEIKAQVEEEKEVLKRKKIELEIKKKEATAEREKQLKANPELVSNTKAEKEYTRLIAKLDKEEMALQKQLIQKDVKIANTAEQDKLKLARILERKDFIKAEIEKIEAEIESIAKEEADMWEEYKLAKQEAKKRKAEYKAQQSANKSSKKSTSQTEEKAKKDTNKKSAKKSKPTNEEKLEKTEDEKIEHSSQKEVVAETSEDVENKKQEEKTESEITSDDNNN